MRLSRALGGATLGLAAASLALAIAGTTHARDSPVRTTHERVRFPAAAGFDYQIGGAYPPPPGVEILDRDRGARPVAGLYNICYVNAFQAQTHELRWWRRHHADLLLRTTAGKLVIDRDWGEPLLDTRTAAKRAALARIVGGWFAGCARAGFQAVEPDNLDSFDRSAGLLSLGDNLAYARLLATRAHADALDIAQKNLAEHSREVHVLGYDFAIAEQCQQYAECRSYTSAYGRRLIDVEYVRSDFARACRRHGREYSILLRDLDVVRRGTRGYVDERCA